MNTVRYEPSPDLSLHMNLLMEMTCRAQMVVNYAPHMKSGPVPNGVWMMSPRPRSFNEALVEGIIKTTILNAEHVNECEVASKVIADRLPDHLDGMSIDEWNDLQFSLGVELYRRNVETVLHHFILAECKREKENER